MEGAATGPAKPAVLIVYYTFTQQSLRMADAIADVLRAEGSDVTTAAIGFSDEHYNKHVRRFPMRHSFLDVLALVLAQLRRKTGEIEIPPEADAGDYDLVVIVSPTWWLTTNMPIRSYLHTPSASAVLNGTPFTDVVVCRRYWGSNHRTVRDLGTNAGGRYVEGIHFKYAGGQIRSLLSLISYLGSGEYRERYLGVSIPRTNLTDRQLDEGRAFARRLAAHAAHR